MGVHRETSTIMKVFAVLLLAAEANAAANAAAYYGHPYYRIRSPYGYRKRDAEQVAIAPKVYDGSNYDQPDPTGPYYGHRYGYRKRDAEQVATAPKVYDGSNYDQPDPTGPYYGFPYGYRKR